MNRDANSFLEHSQQMYSLALSLAENGIAVYEHSYDMLAFGSWVLVLGRRKKRFRFIWDGRDGILKVEKALIPDSGTFIKWEEITLELENNRVGENSFKSIEDFIKKNFRA